jgi:uncharacterized protein (TIGR00162 family)
MPDTIIKIKKGIRLKGPSAGPIVIVGLPGIGNVGKLVAEHLRHELKAVRLGTVYSSHFPHQAVMLKNGKIRLVSNSLYLARRPGSKDLIILTGDVQAVTPEGQYSVNSSLIRLFRERLGCSFLYTIGGYNIGDSIVKNPRVFANATSDAAIKSLKGTKVVFGESKGLIWGSAGLLIAFAKMKGMEGVCLMGETNMLEIDAGAAKAVVRELSSALGINIKTDNLDKIIKKTSQIIAELKNQQEAAQMMKAELERQQTGIMPPQLPQGRAGDRPSYIR